MQKTNFIYLFIPILLLILKLTFFEIDLVGITSVLIVILMTLVLIKIYPSIGLALIVALTLRILVMLFGSIFTLPDSAGDALYFEAQGFAWSQGGFLNVFNYYTGFSTKSISWIVALFYSLFGRSFLMAQSISLFFGMASIFVGWHLVKRIWGANHAKKILWLLALFPSTILYSTLILREAYICFFMLLAMHGIVSWTKTGSIRSIILTITGFMGAAFFHGAMILGLILFFIIIGFYYLKEFFNSLVRKHLNFKSLKFLSLFLIFVSASFFLDVIPKKHGEYAIPKLGKINQFLDPSKLIDQINVISSNKVVGDASYSQWLKINSFTELLYKAPIRTIHFIGSPFPWDVSKISHLVGVFDAFFYIYFFYLIMRNLKSIWKNRALRIILLIVICYFFLFGLGVGNFGSGIRHRAKFFIILISLVAPFIPKILFLKKSKSY